MNPANQSTEPGAFLPVDQLTYEQAIQELESIVHVLESGDNSLESALELFERGQLLAGHCKNLLEQAELKVNQITGQGLENFTAL